LKYEVIETVQELINKYDHQIYTDSRKLKSYLNDFYPDQYKRDIRLICDSIDQKIPADILNFNGYEIEDFLYNSLVRKLYDNLGISQDLAEGTVDSWIKILGKSRVKQTINNNLSRNSSLNNISNTNTNYTQSRPGVPLNYVPVDSNTVFMNNDPNASHAPSVALSNGKKIIAAATIVVLSIASVAVGYAANYSKSNSKAGVNTELGSQPKQSTEVNQVQQKNKETSNDRNSKAINAQSNNGNVKADTYYVEYSINNYLYQMVRAINSYNFSMVEPYLITGGQLYNAQKKLITDLNKQNIKERLLEYKITSMEPISDGYRVKTYEKYLIDYNGNEKSKDFKSTYIIRYVNGTWGVSDMLN